MTPTRFRKRPIIVEAVQWTGSNKQELDEFTVDRFDLTRPDERDDDPDITALVYDELHGTWVGVKTGQYVVRGVKGEYYPIAEEVIAETYERVESAPLAAESETTARVFASLHRSAEAEVSRVIALYEQWVKAGPPPLGTPVSRWWDARLAELHAALLPPTDTTQEQ